MWNFGIGYATPYLVNSGPGNAGLSTNVFYICMQPLLPCLTILTLIQGVAAVFSLSYSPSLRSAKPDYSPWSRLICSIATLLCARPVTIGRRFLTRICTTPVPLVKKRRLFSKRSWHRAQFKSFEVSFRFGVPEEIHVITRYHCKGSPHSA